MNDLLAENVKSWKIKLVALHSNPNRNNLKKYKKSKIIRQD